MKYVNYILAAIFILSGSAKLLGLDFEIEAFQRWQLPLTFMYIVGLLEVAGGAALVANILKKYAALGLSLLMIGALVTHFQHNEWPMFAIAGSILIASCANAFSIWFRQPNQ
jgi:putative oxidoreductase